MSDDATADACAAAIESVNQLHETIGTTAAICLAMLLFVLVFRNRR